jgi:hypothetical protein
MPITGAIPVSPARQRDQLAGHQVRNQVGPGDIDQALQCLDRITHGAKVQGDEVGLATGQHGDRRCLVAEMAAIVDFSQHRLDRAVAAIDGEHGGTDAGDGPHRLADLVGAFDFVVEDIGMIGAKGADARELGKVARRLRIADQCDPGPRHQPATELTPRPLI